MNTADFKTMSTIVHRKNPSNPDTWVLGLDMGYSSVKGFAPNKYFSFPAYARRVPASRVTLKDPQSTDIKYRESPEDQYIWVVGELAYEDVNASDVIDSEEELYGKNHYYSSMFKVLARTGMALGLMRNMYGAPEDRRFKIQTGLPTKYKEEDAPYIKEVLSGHHKFEIKIGSGDWRAFDFTLDESDIDADLEQPLGAVLSVAIDAEGHQLPIAQQLFSSNVIMFDPGFGTLDDYVISHGTVISEQSNTFADLGMREIFARTCRDIEKTYHVRLQIPELQSKLSDGMVRSMGQGNKREMKRTKHSFAEILQKNCQNVCYEAIEKMKAVHNYFMDTDYIIATGGTYDAWKEDFNNVFRDMEDLSIIPANINDPGLPSIFANARGYYFFMNGTNA